MLWMLLMLQVAVSSAAPPAPAPPAPPLRAAIVAFSAGAAFDWATTYYGMHHGGHESNPLIRGLQSHPVAMIAAGAGIDAAMVLGVRAIGKHQPRMAKTYLYIAAHFRVMLAARNLHRIWKAQ